MILGATEQDTAPHISQSNVLGNPDGFTFKVCLDSNPYYLGSSHIALCETPTRSHFYSWQPHSHHLSLFQQLE